MQSFFTVLILEFRRTFARRNVAIALLFVLLLLYFFQVGIQQYRTIIGNKKKFQEIENIKVQNYINYAQYGGYGFRLLFIPSPLSVYFVNSSLISELTSIIDSADILKIYNSLNGGTLFTEKSGGFKDFSGIFFLFGTLLALFFGFETFLHKDYMRFISSAIQPKKLFFSIVISRIFLLILFLLFTMLCSLILVEANNLGFVRKEFHFLLIQIFMMLLIQFFFFFSGMCAGTLKSRFTGFLMVILIWFAFIFLFPGAIWSILASKADNITPTYNLELQKLKTIMDFEKKAIESVGRYSNTKAQTKEGRKLVLDFWNYEYAKIKKLEKKVEREMVKNIHIYYQLSLFFPTSFYLAVCNEISSKGYKNFINFFRYIQNLKEQFVKFYIKKRLDANLSPVESFVKREENIFYSTNMLPDYFGIGVILGIFYNIFLIFLSYHFFKKSLAI